MIYRRLLSVAMALLFAATVIVAFQPSAAEARGFHGRFHGRQHHGGFHHGHRFHHGSFHHHRFHHRFHGPRPFVGFHQYHVYPGYYPYYYYPYWPGVSLGVGFWL